MERVIPVPGDLILVDKSEWYGLKDGELLRVCEQTGWGIPGRDIFVAPRHQVRSFWGPANGPPDGKTPVRISTSGGPFKTVTLRLIKGLVQIGTQLDEFWHWLDRPRSGGGVDYQREVALWRLPLLPDGSWLDPEMDEVRLAPEGTLGPIRLGCLYCDRADFDGVFELPNDWSDIQAVQSLEEASRQVEESDSDSRSVLDWETHLGVCPACQVIFCGPPPKVGEV